VFVALLLFIASCNNSDNPKLYGHFEGRFQGFQSTLDLTYINDSTIYISILYSNYTRFAETTTTIKDNKFDLLIYKDFYTKDTLAYYKCNWTDDKLIMEDQLKEGTLVFNEVYNHSLKPKVYVVDTTVSNDSVKLLIYQANTLKFKYKFKFIPTYNQIYARIDTLAGYAKEDYKFAADNGYSWFMPYSYYDTWYIVRNSDNLLTLEHSVYSYTGGAHGNSYDLFYNIDIETGELIKLNDIITDTTAIKDLLWERLVKRDIPLLVGKDDFYITGNFDLSRDAITFVYNQYEVAPYSEGTIEITLYFDRISKYLKTSYLKRFFPKYKF